MVSTLVDLSTCDPTSISRFCLEIEHEQNDILPWALEHLDYFGISRQNSVTFEVAGETFEMSHVGKKVFLPNLCKNDMYQVEIFLN